MNYSRLIHTFYVQFTANLLYLARIRRSYKELFSPPSPSTIKNIISDIKNIYLGILPDFSLIL